VIREEHVNAGWALRTVSDQLHARFAELSDEYLKERSSDLDDVLGRIQLNLAGSEGAPSLSRLPGPVVLVAEDLTPSEAADLDWEQVLAVAIDAGSKTYHTAILARSLAIPAVVGLREATRRIRPGALVVVDGSRGEVVVEPSAPALARYRIRQESDREEDRQLRETRALPTVTRDGVAVRLQANVEFADEAATGLLYGAEGIGLFRSEFLLGQSRRWPPEEKQIDLYRRLLEQVRPHPVTVRTWDVEADELSPGGPSMLNPALGERGSRLMRRCPEPFRVQLRALLRTALHGPLRIMLPFVSGPEDARWALDLLEQERQALRHERTPFAEDVEVGVNVEVPSAAATADLLARDVDFFSIGTNDLIQYLLAVDRADPRVASLYEPLHPAVLRTILAVVSAATEQGLPVSVCGEMAADPVAALALVGLGVRDLSMTASAIPRVKAAIRGVEASRAREVALRCLGKATAGEIEATLRRDLSDALASAVPAKE
jgi:phosphotransferase system enzyme I (PtsI)